MEPEEAPVVSLDDLLVGRRLKERAGAVDRTPLLFVRCQSTAEERTLVEEHVRRCLRCPLLASVHTIRHPPHEAREELL